MSRSNFLNFPGRLNIFYDFMIVAFITDFYRLLEKKHIKKYVMMKNIKMNRKYVCNWVFIGLVSFIIFIFFFTSNFWAEFMFICWWGFSSSYSAFFFFFYVYILLFFLHSLIQFNSEIFFFFREYAGIN